MKIQELEIEQQDSLIKTLGRFVYPLYITTGVQGFDYHFIGTSFLIEKGKRRFFVFTRHQAQKINNGDLCIGYPQESTKFIRFHKSEIRQFPKSDLAACECDAGCPEELFALDSSLVMPPALAVEQEVMLVGLPVELNKVNHESKHIVATKIAIFTEDIDLNDGFSSIDLNLNSHLLGTFPQHNGKLSLFNDLTQGLSGSPIFAFNVLRTNSQQGELDVNMIGVATHVAEKEQIMSATRTQELIACLHIGFGAYPELDEISK